MPIFGVVPTRGSKQEIARSSRRRSTPSEAFVWEMVRNRQLLGLKFRRQHVLGPFVADFYCPELRLVLEIDGGIHLDPVQAEKDRLRDDWMRIRDFQVLRVSASGIDREMLAQKVGEFIPSSPVPLSLVERERGVRASRGRGEAEADTIPQMHPSPPPLSLAELRAAFEGGASWPVLFFPDGGTRTSPPGPGCLSQWGVSEFEIDGIRFRSAEQAMMHGKAVLFGDHGTAARIAACRTSFQAQLLGRTVSGFDDGTWVEHREEVVVRANLAKFSQDPELRDYLLSTRGSILAEASATDLVWGAGTLDDHPGASDPRRWPGLNLLGSSLMRVRARLLELYI
jgi:ribA/ribD-fused uncharacterized protein